MTFTPREYPAIVRDLLTTVTGGTVREPAVVPAGDGAIVLDRLADRPIRRVSHLAGVVDAPTEADPARTIPYRFTAADFELVSVGGTGEPDAIRFRDGGRRPAAGSTVTVNYYPLQVGALPLTDLNVGSVVRTLLESIARELATIEVQLQHVYDSAFLDTATGSSLDRVVALVGVTRLPTGHPVAKVRFSRATGSAGRITVPAGTVVTDADDHRYATVAPLVLEPGEPSREVLASGATPTTAAVDAGAIDRLEVLIAGVAAVTNESPGYRLSAPETDDDLRRRARGALAATGRGTVDAIRFGVLSIPGVTAVTVVEEPNGVPGEVRVDVAYEQEPGPDLLADVAGRIDELRPAGVRVLTGQATRTPVAATIQLTLAGAGVPAATLAEITAGVEQRLADHIRSIPPGGTIRGAKLVSLALADERVADASITLDAGSGDEASVTLPAGSVADPALPFTFPDAAIEQPGAAAAVATVVDALVPVHLLAGVTAADASAVLRAAITSYLGGLGPAVPLTVDGLVAAARDDTRYGIDRPSVLVTVEGGGRFLQLTDGAGSHAPAATETLTLRTLEVPVAEAGA